MIRRRMIGGVTLLPLIPFVAPSTFDATAQAVNIHKIYSDYAGANKAYGYIFSDTVNTLTLSAGTGISYCYGYTRGGVDYVVDNQASATNPFTATIDTKRWVIVNNTGTGLKAPVPNGGIWVYIGSRCISVNSGNNASLKYVHYQNTSFIATITNAFISCTSLTGDVTIPDHFTTLDDYTFYNCTALSGTITINATNLTLGLNPFARSNAILPNQIGGNWEIYDKILYKDVNRTLLVGCSLNKTGALNLPSTITSIGNYAFRSNTGLTGQLTIPSGVTYIGVDAYYGCSNLTGTLTLPTGLTAINLNAFLGCGISGALNIPSNITTIGGTAFANCNGLTSIVFNQTAIAISTGAFQNDANVTVITIPVNFNPTGGGANIISFSNILTADSLNQYILNRLTATFTLTMGATNKARLLAAYPNAETDANARGITIV